MKTRPYDSAEYLDTPEAIEEYLAAARESGDPIEIAHAREVVARARRIHKIPSSTRKAHPAKRGG